MDYTIHIYHIMKAKTMIKVIQLSAFNGIFDNKGI